MNEIQPTNYVPRLLFDSELASLRREIGAVEKAAKLALDSADKATAIADANFEKRMDTTNEWRAALEDQSKRLATMEMVEMLKTRIEAIEKKLEAMLNKVIGFGLLITVIVNVVAIFGRWQ